MNVRNRHLSIAWWCLVAVGLLAGCGSSGLTSANGGSSAASTSSTAASAPAPAAAVAGLIALGHSALTGENSDPGRPGQEVRANSWATGTNPAVDSIYQRMVAIRPATAGHVANLAEAGAPAARLAEQAQKALAQVPLPALAIIQSIDADIHCDGTDAGHVKEFGQQVQDALRVITLASPSTRILIITQPGRPATELQGMASAISADPKAKAVYAGPPPCGMYDDSGRLVPADITALTAIIASYEAEQARVCAQVPACSTDGGALAAFQRVPAMVSSDYNHLNVLGLSRLAAAVWPSAEAALARPLPTASSSAIGASPSAGQSVSASSPHASSQFSGLVDIGGGRHLYAQCQGTGGPTILLEAGDESDIGQWAQVMAQLVGEARTCSYERLGVDRSDFASGCRGPDDLRHDTEALLKALGENGPFLVVGHSGGGFLMADYAYAHPDQVAGLVLVETPKAINPRLAPADLLAQIDCHNPDNEEHRNYVAVENFAWGQRHRIGDIPMTVISNRYTPPYEDYEQPTNVRDQRGWFVLSPQARQVVVTSGHEVEENQPDLVSREILRVLALTRRAGAR